MELREGGPGDRFDFCPWLFWVEATEQEQARQLAWQEALRDRGLRDIGHRSFVSPLAAIHLADLTVGSESYLAAHVYLTDEVRLGDHTTVNPYATVRGRVHLGDGVRVGAHASLLGFNHAMDPSAPVYQQPITSLGITVGDDVWLGSQAIVLDGVTIGPHSVIGAGAVVTRDVPPWSVMAGNPARRIRDRRQPSGRGRVTGEGEALARFAAQARDQAPALLDRYVSQEAGPGFVNQPGSRATLRASCDAVEVADLLLGGAPPQVPAAELAAWLAGRTRAPGWCRNSAPGRPRSGTAHSAKGWSATTSWRWDMPWTCWAAASATPCTRSPSSNQIA